MKRKLEIDNKNARFFYYQRGIPTNELKQIENLPNSQNIQKFTRFAYTYPYGHAGYVCICVIHTPDSKTAQIGFSFLPKKFPWDSEAKYLCRLISYGRAQKSIEVPYIQNSRKTAVTAFNNASRENMPGFCKNFYITWVYRDELDAVQTMPWLQIDKQIPIVQDTFDTVGDGDIDQDTEFVKYD